ncbi:myotubularin-related protein DDB_G0290005-like isoform X2 [Drosophila obscura]|uniref:myotubularin-related protein DDB_G0290005-like isoform X2 n=1 Tax=Drosophila obscura TaxID=7282 RepID=UPI000BA16B69|nr:myotubularin-related protein DDB_G0290005-like isoform X2 [Drosophila obscura]
MGQKKKINHTPHPDKTPQVEMDATIKPRTRSKVAASTPMESNVIKKAADKQSEGGRSPHTTKSSQNSRTSSKVQNLMKQLDLNTKQQQLAQQIATQEQQRQQLTLQQKHLDLEQELLELQLQEEEKEDDIDHGDDNDGKYAEIRTSNLG